MQKKLLFSCLLLSSPYIMFGQKDYKKGSYYQNLTDLKKLNYAIDESDIPTITTLLTKVDINSQDTSGSTPLHNAIADGNLKIIQLLVNSGANINAKDKKGYTPLYEVFNSLIESIVMIYCDSIETDQSILQDIIDGYALKYITIAQYLVASGADTTLQYNTDDNWYEIIPQNKYLTLLDIITEVQSAFTEELTKNNYDATALKACIKHFDTFKSILQRQ